MVIKTLTCNFSQAKIYPGHGKQFVRLDAKLYNFLNAKCASSFHCKWNPRKMAWTQLYRRMHKKGADGEKRVLKKTRKANTKGRGVFGASIEEIKKKRDQSAAARATARAKALRDAKAKKAAKAKSGKASARHNQGGNKQQYARPTSRGAKGKAVTGRGK